MIKHLSSRRAQRVSSLWKEVSERPTLWQHVDLAKGMAAGWKCPTSKSGFTGFLRRRLGPCRVLNLANCHNVMSQAWAVQVFILIYIAVFPWTFYFRDKITTGLKI